MVTHGMPLYHRGCNSFYNLSQRRYLHLLHQGFLSLFTPIFFYQVEHKYIDKMGFNIEKSWTETMFLCWSFVRPIPSGNQTRGIQNQPSLEGHTEMPLNQARPTWLSR